MTMASDLLEQHIQTLVKYGGWLKNQKEDHSRSSFAGFCSIRFVSVCCALQLLGPVYPIR